MFFFSTISMHFKMSKRQRTTISQRVRALDEFQKAVHKNKKNWQLAEVAAEVLQLDYVPNELTIRRIEYDVGLKTKKSYAGKQLALLMPEKAAESKITPKKG